MIFTRILIAIVLILCLINYVVDFAFYLRQRYCRFHIGRWKQKEWKEAIESRAITWLKRTPVVKITDNSRYMLLDIIGGKYRSHTIQSWQKAALILGLLESEKPESTNKAKLAALSLLDSNGEWKQKPTRVDCGMISYALLQAIDDHETIRRAMRTSAEVIASNINEDGMISYTGEKDNPNIYVDMVGLCCPFLFRYAKEYNMPEYESIAFNQIREYHRNGLLNNTALTNHAYNLENKLPLGVYGWGRGIGWYVIGLMDSYEEITNKEYKTTLKKWILEAAEEYKRYQNEDGGFGAILQRPKSYDSSATAVLAWFYAKCSKLFESEEYYKISEKSLHKLLLCTRINGAIDWCQGDTKDIGVFSQTYDIMPFAQGMALRAIHARK